LASTSTVPFVVTVMSSDHRKRSDSGSAQPQDLQYRHYKPWETQARFLKSGQNKSRALDSTSWLPFASLAPPFHGSFPIRCSLSLSILCEFLGLADEELRRPCGSLNSKEIVEREKEKVKRHNRLVDLKLEEQAKMKKRRHYESEAPVASVPFGKESLQDDEYSHLVDEVKATRKQQKTEHKQQKREQEEAKLKSSSKKRKRDEVSPETESKAESSSKSEEPPAKLKAEPSSSHTSTKDAKASEEAAQSETPKGKPARSFAEARARWEDKQRQQQEQREAYEKRQQEIALKQEDQRKASKKLMKRTPRGQPIMKNVIGHMLSKLEKQGLRK